MSGDANADPPAMRDPGTDTPADSQPLLELQRLPLPRPTERGAGFLDRRPVVAALAEEAALRYRQAWPDADLVEFDADGATFLYDLAENGAGGSTREGRTVAAWAISRGPAAPRDASRQRGYPLAESLRELGYERGHLIAHASGGGLDANLFAQVRHINRGRSNDGRAFRDLERLAAGTPGAWVFHQLSYAGPTPVPDRSHLLVITDHGVHERLFSNNPLLPASASRRRLGAGVVFHRRVQLAFAAGLTGAEAAAEHAISLYQGRRGRVDLVIVPSGSERSAVVVEVKNTHWDAFAAHRVRPNLREHLRQLQRYLDPLIDGLAPATDHETPELVGLLAGPWDSVSGVLLYPTRPREPARGELIENLVAEQALSIVWYDETDWAN